MTDPKDTNTVVYVKKLIKRKYPSVNTQLDHIFKFMGKQEFKDLFHATLSKDPVILYQAFTKNNNFKVVSKFSEGLGHRLATDEQKTAYTDALYQIACQKISGSTPYTSPDKTMMKEFLLQKENRFIRRYLFRQIAKLEGVANDVSEIYGNIKKEEPRVEKARSTPKERAQLIIDKEIDTSTYRKKLEKRKLPPVPPLPSEDSVEVIRPQLDANGFAQNPIAQGADSWTKDSPSSSQPAVRKNVSWIEKILNERSKKSAVAKEAILETVKEPKITTTQETKKPTFLQRIESSLASIFLGR